MERVDGFHVTCGDASGGSHSLGKPWTRHDDRRDGRRDGRRTGDGRADGVVVRERRSGEGGGGEGRHGCTYHAVFSELKIILRTPQNPHVVGNVLKRSECCVKRIRTEVCFATDVGERS